MFTKNLRVLNNHLIKKILFSKFILKKKKFYLFEFIKMHRANLFLIKLNAKLKFKILNINKISNTREKTLIKIIMQKKTLKRTRSNNENHFIQFKIFKNFFNKFNN